MNIKYNPEKHHRRSIRLKGHDYAGGGLYFVTMCAKSRKPILGTMQNGKNVLSEGGRVAEQCWHAIPEHFPNVEAGAFVALTDYIAPDDSVTGPLVAADAAAFAAENNITPGCL